jgi:hypothetical protein
VKNSGGPSVGERTIESPLFITGAPCRQNGPRRLQVPDKRLHDLHEPRVVGSPGLREDSLGELQLVLNDHGNPLSLADDPRLSAPYGRPPRGNCCAVLDEIAGKLRWRL